MTQVSNKEQTLTSITNQLDQIINQIDQIINQLKQINLRLSKIEQELKETNNRVEVYQKASTQVVNLAFSLIASATVTVIIASVLPK